MIMQSSFKASWWLANPHLQTIVAKWLKQKQTVTTIRETLDLTDGDFLDLAWSELPKSNQKKPIVVILHGLAGSVDSHYVKGMLHAIKQQQWIGVVMHFRGCSGRPNKLARSYHSGDTRDLHFLTSLLEQRFPDHPKFALGYSLGGNVLTKFLAEKTDNPYRACSIVCAPLDLASCSQRINSGWSKVYQKYLVTMLKNGTAEKIQQRLVNNISVKQLAKITSMRDFDHYVTAPINGFASAEDYYHRASGGKVINHINNPCLFIHAADDPFLNHQAIVPQQPLPAHITFEVSESGGHVGFICGKNPLKPQYWLEHRIPAYLRSFL